MAAICVNNLSKAYGDTEALRGVSFEVEKGELFGLIGPDGAGKTTLFRLLTTLLNPDGGTATVDGLDIRRDYKAIRQRIGYMPGRFSLYQDLSVEENIAFFASLFGTTLRENYDLVAPIYRQIEPFRKRRAGKLSGGMKQKLALCCALIHRPTVLFLDEPTTGVDAVSRSEFMDMLENLRAQQITILLSTPYMSEASRCSRIALMNGGKLLCTDTPQAIAGYMHEPLYTLSGDNMFGLLTASRAHGQVVSCYAFGDTHHLTVKPDFDEEAFAAYLQQQGFGSVRLQRAAPGIEDVFIKLTQP